MIELSRLRELLTYNPETGQFRWTDLAPRREAGKVAGTELAIGYRSISIERQSYYEHKLAWFYMTDKWERVDHINRVRNDNRFCNLRECNRSENNVNKSIRSDNTTGFTGVSFNKKRNCYEVYISMYGKRTRLGFYPDLESAISIRKGAELKYHGDFSQHLAAV